MTANDDRAAALALAESSDSRRIDHDAVRRAARELLRALGADVDGGAREETPRRVADARPRARRPPHTRQEFLALTTRTSHDQ